MSLHSLSPLCPQRWALVASAETARPKRCIEEGETGRWEWLTFCSWPMKNLVWLLAAEKLSTRLSCDEEVKDEVHTSPEKTACFHNYILPVGSNVGLPICSVAVKWAETRYYLLHPSKSTCALWIGVHQIWHHDVESGPVWWSRWDRSKLTAHLLPTYPGGCGHHHPDNHGQWRRGRTFV